MGLTYRKKNEGGAYLVRGFVEVGTFGRETVAEHSSGCIREDEVKAYCSKYEETIRQKLMYGVTVLHRQITWKAAKKKWLDMGGHHKSDLSRAIALDFAFENKTLGEIDAAAFTDFIRDYMGDNAKNTIERHRGVMNAIFAANGVKVPEVPSFAQKKVNPQWLPLEDADRLIASYVHHVQPIAIVAADCGLRASENYLLEVRQCRPTMGDFGAFVIGTEDRETKNMETRNVPWTERVRNAVLPLIADRDPFDRVFLNMHGEPYSDTREQGGNPLSKAHRTALKDAGMIAKDHTGKLPFKWHAWRHQFGTWGLASTEYGGRGWTVPQLMSYGGWKDYDSVKHYVGVVDNLFVGAKRRA